ncbi:MAG: CAP domain-containing protein, partial [Chloroflexi bacterium]|nr:CAP domain-containing protein [Chloroflexota bacterium]
MRRERVWWSIRIGAAAALLAVLLALGGWVAGRRGGDGLDRTAAARIIDLTNDARQREAKAPLSISPQLTAAAEEYARVMARREWFEHIDPDGVTVERRAEAFGYADWAFLAENLVTGTGSRDASYLVESWLSSPEHRRNILSADLQEVGVGCYVRKGSPSRFWCAQEFG